MASLWTMSQVLKKIQRRQPLIALTTICVTLMVLYLTVLRSEYVGSFLSRHHSSVTDQTKSLIKFMPLPENKNIDNYTFDNVNLYPCSQPNGPGADNIVDLMCIPRPIYLLGFKNPCFRNESVVLKCLPYYKILGFDKCGTTDFFSRLTSHPAILQNNGFLGKEIFYWGRRRLGNSLRGPVRVMSLEDYSYAFRDAAVAIIGQESKDNQPIVGDGTPVDGWEFRNWPLDPQNKGLSEPKVLVPHVMRHILREPKFFFLMREPADRLYSDYFFMKNGDTPEKFDRDVPVAIEMMNSCLKVNTTRQCFFGDYRLKSLPMRLHIGCYSVFIREWLAVFHRKHFLFLRTEDYKRNMKETLQAAFSFLGVEPVPDSKMDNILHHERKHETKKKKTAGAMLDRTRQLLNDFYEPCNADLADLLGDKKYLWLDF